MFISNPLWPLLLGLCLVVPALNASATWELAHGVHYPQVSEQALLKQAKGLSAQVLSIGLRAYQKASKEGLVQNPKLTIIDYSQPSDHQRLWIFDMKTQRLKVQTFVAHGLGSGELIPTRFSNQINSHTSSLGIMKTGALYQGGKGLSLRLHGLEPGINHNVFKRNVVIHGAKYVEPKHIARVGQAGRSWGCPAVGYQVLHKVLNEIEGGSLLLIYYPDASWLKRSEFL
jgi:hypothetical protein